MRELAGIGAAVVAALGYEAAYLLQTRAVRARPVERLRLGLLSRLARDRLWLGAIGVIGVAAGLHVVALMLVPLTIVQPTLAFGLIALVWAAPGVLGERPGVREHAAVIAIVAGVTACAVAAPDIALTRTSGEALAPLLAALAVVVVAPFGLRRGAGDPRLSVCAAAAGDALAGLAFKLAADALVTTSWTAAVAWLAVAGAAAALAVTAEMSALQRLAATAVAPVIVAAQVAVPVGAATLLLGEEWGATPLGGWLVAGALLVVVMAAAVLGSATAGQLDRRAPGAAG